MTRSKESESTKQSTISQETFLTQVVNNAIKLISGKGQELLSGSGILPLDDSSAKNKSKQQEVDFRQELLRRSRGSSDTNNSRNRASTAPISKIEVTDLEWIVTPGMPSVTKKKIDQLQRKIDSGELNPYEIAQRVAREEPHLYMTFRSLAAHHGERASHVFEHLLLVYILMRDE